MYSASCTITVYRAGALGFKAQESRAWDSRSFQLSTLGQNLCLVTV